MLNNNNLILQVFNHPLNILESNFDKSGDKNPVKLVNVFGVHDHSRAAAPTDPPNVKGIVEIKDEIINGKDKMDGQVANHFLRAIISYEFRYIAHGNGPANVANDGRKVSEGKNYGNVVNDARNLGNDLERSAAEDAGAGEVDTPKH